MAAHFDSGVFYNPDLKREWHSLGNYIERPPATVEQCMKDAGMDWSVTEQPLTDIVMVNGKPTMMTVDGMKSLRRSDNQRLLHVCNNTWTPVQNVDAFRWFDPIIQDGDAEISAAVSLNEGKRIAITAKIKAEADVVPGDSLESYLLLYNAHDGTLCLGIKFTNIRVVCSNTLAANLYNKPKFASGEDVTWNPKYARLRHTASIHDNLELVRDAINLAQRKFTGTVDEYKAMASKSMNDELFRSYLEAVFKDQLKQDDPDKPLKPVTKLQAFPELEQNFHSGIGIGDNPQVRGTVWAGLNAVTQWTTHQRGNATDDVEAARSRLNSLWFGNSEKVNEKAHQEALALTLA